MNKLADQTIMINIDRIKRSEEVKRSLLVI